MVFWSTYYYALNFLKSTRELVADRILFDKTKNSLTPRKKDEKLLLLQAISGSIGGISAAIFTNPLEIIRIRIQVFLKIKPLLIKILDA